ncbi:MAG: oxidoreductase [Gemmatimonadales bacterium]
MFIARFRIMVQTTVSLAVAAGCSGTAAVHAAGEPAAGPDAWRRWDREVVPSTASCRSVSAASVLVAWAGCTGGRVFRTVDGGATWNVDTIPGAARLDFRGIKAFDANTAVVASAGAAEQGQAHIYRTADGGSHWSLAWSDTTKGVFLDGIAFWDARHGFTFSDPVDGRLVILTSDDGGSTWTRTPPASIPPVLPGEAAFAASNTQLAVQGSSNAWIATGGAAEARVFRSTDRGRTWQVSSTGLPGGKSAGLFGIAFADARHGLAVGGDYAIARGPTDRAIRTDDGGVTWSAAGPAAPDGVTTGLAFLAGSSPPSFAAAGAHGTAVTRDFGATWIHGDTLTYWSVSFAGRTGWAAGPRGRVAKFTAPPK